MLYYNKQQLKNKFHDLPWWGVYDFIEFILSIDYRSEDLQAKLNKLFEEEKIPYQIIGGKVVPQITQIEAQEVEKAITGSPDIVSGHLNRAIENYSKRPMPDYKNSIKESIHAIEALAKFVLNKPDGTLGELTQQLKIHPAFQAGINKLYGWTSDEGGIRHSEKPGNQLDSGAEEARLLLILSSALVNYIQSKYK